MKGVTCTIGRSCVKYLGHLWPRARDSHNLCQKIKLPRYTINFMCKHERKQMYYAG